MKILADERKAKFIAKEKIKADILKKEEKLNGNNKGEVNDPDNQEQKEEEAHDKDEEIKSNIVEDNTGEPNKKD